MTPTPQIDHYRRFLREQRGLVFEDYASLWGWSVTELDAFWRSIWDHFDLRSATPFEAALNEERMPGAVWFRGATLNIAAQALRHTDAADAAGHPAIVHADEAMLARGELGELRWPELRRQVGALAAALHELGVRRGDRVVAYLPNVPQTAVAFLAVASLGAVWSVCSPDMGPVAVLDRFRQIEPKVLIAADGVRYAGQAIDRREMLVRLLDELPTVGDVVLLGNLDADAQGQGHPLIDEVGELVCTRPMPSMPLYFWGDRDHERYLSSYFDMYRGPHGEGIWRHGDWLRITPAGGGIIYGRSDATINRHGIRMGTAELYRAVETHEEVLDSLVVDLEYLGRPSCLLLFVQLRDGVTLDAALQQRLRESIKKALSARHVPDEIHQVEAIPRTLSGKKMELPIKKLLLGAAAEQVMKRDAMANADAVAWYQAFARGRA